MDLPYLFLSIVLWHFVTEHGEARDSVLRNLFPMEAKSSVLSGILLTTTDISELQIKRVNGDNSELIILISRQKHIL